MKTRMLHEQDGLKSFAVVFEKDEDVNTPLLAFANEQGLSAAQVTAIGAFSDVTLGYFDRQKKTYREIPVREQVEVLSFAGNITQVAGKCKPARSRRHRQIGWQRSRRALFAREGMAYAGDGDCRNSPAFAQGTG